MLEIAERACGADLRRCALEGSSDRAWERVSGGVRAREQRETAGIPLACARPTSLGDASGPCEQGAGRPAPVSPVLRPMHLLLEALVPLPVGGRDAVAGGHKRAKLSRYDVRASAADTRARPGCTGIAPRSCACVWSLITPAPGKLLVAPYDQHRTRTCSRLPRACFPLCFAVRPGCVDAGPFVMARSSISVWTCFIPSPLCNAARQRYCLGHEDIQ